MTWDGWAMWLLVAVDWTDMAMWAALAAAWVAIGWLVYADWRRNRDADEQEMRNRQAFRDAFEKGDKS